jgi:hypothetical protein
MEGRGVPGLGELGVRVTVVEAELGELRELVDGQESWSHRKRLHALEDNDRAAKIVREALDELRKARRGRGAQIREWGGFILATVALVVSLYLRAHGAG